MPANTPYLSDQTTNLSNLSLNGANSANIWSSTISARQIEVVGSTGTLNIRQGRLMSVRTLAASALTASAAATNVADSETGFVIGGASGASLYIRSAGTVWIFNSAASAAIA